MRQPDAQLGLVATRSVVVPHYARRPGTDLDVRANIVAFGYGLRGTTSALRAFPAAQGPRGDNPDNYGAAFTLTGSIAAPSLEASLPGWSRVAVVTDPASVAAPPPYFPGFTTAWVSLGSDRLSSYDVCGRTSCAQVW